MLSRLLSVLLYQTFTDPVLVPDPASDLGKEVATWRQMLFDVKMYVITFGTALNPSLSVTGVKLMPQQTYEG